MLLINLSKVLDIMYNWYVYTICSTGIMHIVIKGDTRMNYLCLLRHAHDVQKLFMSLSRTVLENCSLGVFNC